MSLLFFFSSRRRHTRSVSAFLLNRSSDLKNFLSTPLIRLFLLVLILLLMPTLNFLRSEERRVGKECRSRWWPYLEKRKGEHGRTQSWCRRRRFGRSQRRWTTSSTRWQTQT